MYGCHNRPRPQVNAPLQVQDGYETNMLLPNDRIDRMVTIPFVMTTECQYTKTHQADQLCNGCQHKF